MGKLFKPGVPFVNNLKDTDTIVVFGEFDEIESQISVLDFKTTVGGSTQVGITTLVVADNGNDLTAVKGDSSFPYKTLIAAKNAANSGDTILVMPGLYPLTQAAFDATPGSGNAQKKAASLWKDGIDWYFNAGAVVSLQTDITTGAGIFHNIIDGGEICNVYGEGDFVWGGAAFVTNNTNSYIINVDSADIECNFNANLCDGGEHEFPITTGGKLFDVRIRTLKNGKGGCILVSGNNNKNSDTFNYHVGRIESIMTAAAISDSKDFGSTIKVLGGNGTTSFGRYKFNFEFGTIIENHKAANEEGSLFHFSSAEIKCQINGKYAENTRTGSLAAELITTRGSSSAHSMTIQLHIDKCIADSLASTGGLIVTHCDSSNGVRNQVYITGTYECLDGPVVSDNSSGATNNNAEDYVINATLIGHLGPVVNVVKANSNFTLSGRIVNKEAAATGDGIAITIAATGLKLKQLDIFCENASAVSIAGSTATSIEASSLSANRAKEANVTLTAPTLVE